jgi:signal transduction histidine kinase
MARGANRERRRLLTMLGFVVLPAAALIGFSVLQLRSIQRDKAIEAAIQRDFQHMLAISEKHIINRVYHMANDVESQMPNPYDPDAESKLQALVDANPFAAHVFMWGKDKGALVRSQSRHVNPAGLSEEGKKYFQMMASSFDTSGAAFVEKMRKMKANGEGYIFSPVWFKRDGKELYTAAVLYPLSAPGETRPAIGGLIFDPDFLRSRFFPETLNSLLAETGVDARKDKSSQSRAAMMIRCNKDPQPLATSSNWDGGTPEMERKLEAGFPGLTLAIKFRGTTVEAIGQRFLRISFLVLGGLSLLLAAGVVLTYRGVSKEVELAKIKSDFVSNVSHELRTPLALIRLYAETLELGRVTDPNKQVDYYSTIRKESERLTALINNILDFSRIEAGRKEYDFRETNLAELVSSTVESYRYEIEQQGFKFEEHIEPDIPTVVVDREAIALSLINLVNNAIKYSSRDRYLAVTLSRSNGSVILDVVDHGIGIPRVEQSKIFEKFYRVSDPLVHNTKGCGLGLCLVRQIVHAHGGEVTVESTPGKGSKFSLVLPVQSAGAFPGSREHDVSRGVEVA